MVQPYVAQDPGGFGRLLQAKFQRERLDEQKATNALNRKLKTQRSRALENHMNRQEQALQREKQTREALSGWMKERGADPRVADMAKVNPGLAQSLHQMDQKEQQRSLKSLKIGSRIYSGVRQRLEEAGGSVQENWPTIRSTLQKFGVDEVPDQYNPAFDKEMRIISGIMNQPEPPEPGMFQGRELGETRAFNKGGKEITQEWTREGWKPLGESPRWKPDQGYKPTPEKALRRTSQIRRAMTTLDKINEVTQAIIAVNPALKDMLGQQLNEEQKQDLMDAWQNELDYYEPYLPASANTEEEEEDVEYDTTDPLGLFE